LEGREGKKKGKGALAEKRKTPGGGWRSPNVGRTALALRDLKKKKACIEEKGPPHTVREKIGT